MRPQVVSLADAGGGGGGGGRRKRRFYVRRPLYSSPPSGMARDFLAFCLFSLFVLLVVIVNFWNLMGYSNPHPSSPQPNRDAHFALQPKMSPHRDKNFKKAPSPAAALPPDPTQAQVYAERLKRIERVCKEYDILGKGAVWTHHDVHLEMTHGLAYCEIAKAGCSTWKHHLVMLDDSLNETEKAQYSKKHSIRIHSLRINGLEDPKQFQQFAKDKKLWLFSFVRHPFHRLVSAFVNKVVDKRDPAYLGLAYRIGPNFDVFAQHVLKSLRRCSRVYCHMDRHWQPYNTRCAYCGLKYDFIGKQETFNQDVKHVFEVNRLTGLIPTEDEDMVINQSLVSGSDHERTLKWFSQLNATTREELRYHYQLDFALFDYDPEPYLRVEYSPPPGREDGPSNAAAVARHYYAQNKL